MNDLFGSMDGRLRISITDSTMMWIVHYAMNKAQERMKSKEGVIERLHEISKFYELAVMQLEGCLKFVQAETTDNNILETSHEDVLQDLAEIRDRLRGRIEESALAIAEKDRELNERLENELKLRQALELKERELVSLKSKCENAEELLSNNMTSGDEDRDGEFCELKYSVDQQMLNIKQKIGPDYRVPDGERERSIDMKMVEEMGSDIDILKKTMDLAFGKMQIALCLSEIGPVEQQWRWTIDKDVISISIKGFLKDVKDKFEAEEKMSLSGWRDHHWSHMINVVTNLRQELEPFICQNEAQATCRKEIKSEDGMDEKFDMSSQKVEKVDQTDQKIHKGRVNEDRSHFVAQMVKSHESIIRKKSEEMNWLKQGILQEKRNSSSKKEKENISINRRIHDVIARLDNLISWDEKLGVVHKAENLSEEKVAEAGGLNIHEEKPGTHDSLENVWERITKGVYSGEMLMEENDMEDDLGNKIMEDIYLTLYKSLKEEYYCESYSFSIERLVWENMCKSCLQRTMEQCNEDDEVIIIEAEIRDEVYCIVFFETLRYRASVYESALAKYKDAIQENKGLENTKSTGKYSGDLEHIIREDVNVVLFNERIKECNEAFENYIAENIVREEICWVLFGETLENMARNTGFASRKHQYHKTTCHFLEDFASATIDSSMQQDICMVVFKSMIQEWKKEEKGGNDMESLMREDLNTADQVLEDFLSATLESSMQQDVFMVVFKSMIQELKEEKEGNDTESLMRENLNTAYNFLEDFASTTIESSMQQDVFMVVFKSMTQEWEEEKEANDMESLMREDILQFTMVEALIDAYNLAEETIFPDHQKVVEGIRCPNVQGQEYVIKILDSLLKCCEAEESFMLSARSEIKEHSMQLDLGSERGDLHEHEIFEDLINDDEKTCNSVISKIEKALQQLVISKSLFGKLRSYLGGIIGGQNKFPNLPPTFSTGQSFHRQKKHMQEEIINQCLPIFLPFMRFSQTFADFEYVVIEKIGIIATRLGDMKYSLHPLREHVSLLQKKELRYRRAFVRRCQNLQKAEIEVDLLGDQVDSLQRLLEKTYTILRMYAPALQQYNEVSGILKLIKKQLTHETVHIGSVTK